MKSDDKILSGKTGEDSQWQLEIWDLEGHVEKGEVDDIRLKVIDEIMDHLNPQKSLLNAGAILTLYNIEVRPKDGEDRDSFFQRIHSEVSEINGSEVSMRLKTTTLTIHEYGKEVELKYMGEKSKRLPLPSMWRYLG